MRSARFALVAATFAAGALVAVSARASSVLVLDLESATLGGRVTSVVAAGTTNSFPVRGVNSAGTAGTALVVADPSLWSRNALSVDAGSQLQVDLTSVIPGVSGHGEFVSFRLEGTTNPTRVVFVNGATTRELTIAATGPTGSTVVGAPVGTWSSVNVFFNGPGAIDEVAFISGGAAATTPVKAPSDTPSDPAAPAPVTPVAPVVEPRSASRATFRGDVPPQATVWFESVVRVRGLHGREATIQSTHGTIDVGALHVNVPDARISFAGSAAPRTLFANGAWTTSVPATTRGDVFLAGASLPVPDGLSGASSATWRADFAVDPPDAKVEWRWTASAYADLPTSYSDLRVAPVPSGRDRVGAPTSAADALLRGFSAKWSKFLVAR